MSDATRPCPQCGSESAELRRNHIAVEFECIDCMHRFFL